MNETKRCIEQRLSQQRLVGEPFASPEATVEGLLAVQSQDLLGAMWAVGARAKATRAIVTEAFDRGRILRTHVMRPTWHFVAPEDLRWLQELTAPRVHRLSASIYRSSGLDAPLRARVTDIFARALEGHRHLTREELGAALAAKGIAAEKQTLAYLAMHAELASVIVSGPMRGKATTYALVDERVPPSRPRDRDEALGELVRRYFSSHGPATVHDAAWWSGLTLTDVRRGLAVAANHLEAREEGGVTRIAAVDVNVRRRRGPVAHFLSNYDEYVIAYRDRSAFFDPTAISKLGPPERELASHLILLDGVLIGGWRRIVSRTFVEIAARMLPLRTREARVAIERAKEAVGAFFGLPAVITRGEP